MDASNWMTETRKIEFKVRKERKKQRKYEMRYMEITEPETLEKMKLAFFVQTIETSKISK